METSTIAAIATPVASGGVGVIRMSGPRSQESLFTVFRRFPVSREENGKKTTGAVFSSQSMRSHRFYHGYIVDNDQLIDEVLVVFMRGPRSYTGEDVVEIHAHGSPLVLRAILQLLVHAGVKIAAPGEFTRRAFMNGKMDLTQAEAVADIIAARSVKALNAAANQVAGRMNQEICSIKEEMTACLAGIEASIDFSDQADVQVSLKAVQRSLRSAVADRIQRLINRHDEFSWIKTGVTVALVGIPNVGKSTLLNTLLDRERAIVSAVPGTTRDFIEETVLLDGITFVLTDTAGLRSTAGDELERVGMARTQAVLSGADTIVFMVDAGAAVSPEDYAVMAAIKQSNRIVVANKTDLPEAGGFVFPPEWEAAFPVVKISALTGEGVSALKALLVDQYKERPAAEGESGLIPNLRHKAALEESLKAVFSAIAAIENNLPEDMVAIDLRAALGPLNEITGHNTGPDVLDDIFSRFCVGK